MQPSIEEKETNVNSLYGKQLINKFIIEPSNRKLHNPENATGKVLSMTNPNTNVFPDRKSCYSFFINNCA